MGMREGKKMEFTLNSPLTEEDWEKIYDVDMDSTNSVTFHTKHDKEVEFVKPVRCKDCKSFSHGYCKFHDAKFVREDGYCYWGELKDGDTDGSID